MTARHYRATRDDVLTRELRLVGWFPQRRMECGCTVHALCVAHSQLRAVLHYEQAS